MVVEWFMAGIGLGLLLIVAGYALLWVVVRISALLHLPGLLRESRRHDPYNGHDPRARSCAINQPRQWDCTRCGREVGEPPITEPCTGDWGHASPAHT